ncbi:MAG: hypothetical protein LBF42_03675, partial [Puniceicoccales bacterium]|nr:hypothetical protein [Puniceicoccales bacterium]
FANLSFVDLRERYEQTCSPKREAELMSFFRHFGIEEWEEICPSMNSVSLFEDVRMHASEYF